MLGQGCTQQFRNSTTTGRLLRLAYGRYPGLAVRQLAHVGTVSSPVRHTVTTWSLSHQAPVLVCVPSMSRQGHAQEKVTEGRPPVWFLFPGMGCQWEGMGQSMMKIPMFRQTIERLSKFTEAEFGVDLLVCFTENPHAKSLDKAMPLLPITAIQIALIDMLGAVGLKPDKMFGHSNGEVACAYADNCLTAEQAITVAYIRTTLLDGFEDIGRGKMAAVGLAEVRWSGAGYMKLGSKTLIYSGEHTHERGVSILFDLTTTKNLRSWCPISDRVVVALIAKPLNLSIIQVYAPTSDSEAVELEKFYEGTDKAKGYLKSQDIIMIMGDFNAKIGDERVEDVVGPSDIGTINERGSRLIEWCQINDFTITHTWYQNHPRRQWTWKSPGDRSINKIDFFVIQNRFRNPVKTSKSLPEADFDSDHIPIMCKFQIKLKKERKAKANPKFQMDLRKSYEKLRGKIVHNKMRLLITSQK
ncbi:craniofacial development protein 2-like protein [Plakobranchus ocellatus]|uniref:Craniofacial development protein 2-like protein n=1 Tax=Plakobranchus ocellatus TaxID=259542 RepID=A0AAV4DS26_9GAST|nr:craniofacial development protein 2-like protein [Plakobranchus ocellatus]